MNHTTNKHKYNSRNLIITTGVSSLNYYINSMEFLQKSNSTLYNFMGISTTKNIAKVDTYKVIIDFCDNNINKIVIELLNYLLPLNVDIYVKVIDNISIHRNNAKECMVLLNRLYKNKLIELEVINETSELPKRKKTNYLIKRFSFLQQYIINNIKTVYYSFYEWIRNCGVENSFKEYNIYEKIYSKDKEGNIFSVDCVSRRLRISKYDRC